MSRNYYPRNFNFKTKRLRKKWRLKEFSEYIVKITFIVNFTDKFLDDLIDFVESKNLSIGGSSFNSPKETNCTVYLSTYNGSVNKQQTYIILEWLNKNKCTDVQYVYINKHYEIPCKYEG